MTFPFVGGINDIAAPWFLNSSAMFRPPAR
jgi:hypothetical protein